MDFSKEYQYLLDNLGEDVTVNTTTVKAIVENTNVNTNYDDKIISTLIPLNTGDLVTYKSYKFIILSEINGNRGIDYAGVMRRCDFNIQIEVPPEQVIIGYDGSGRPVYGDPEPPIIGYNDFGEPIYGELETVYIDIPAIVDLEGIVITSGGAINTSNNNLLVTVRDYEDTEDIELNDILPIGEKNYKVTGIDKTKPGLIIFKCEKTT
jgi:hypothetical protein